MMEVVMNMAGHTVTATAKDGNLGKAMDAVIMKVERQMKKINEKIKDHKKPKKNIE
jgi:Sigma 54 modulation protein / S30EA ribosomal protein.